MNRTTQIHDIIANGTGTDNIAKTLFEKAHAKIEGPVKLDLRLVQTRSIKDFLMMSQTTTIPRVGYRLLFPREFFFFQSVS